MKNMKNVKNVYKKNTKKAAAHTQKLWKSKPSQLTERRCFLQRGVDLLIS